MYKKTGWKDNLFIILALIMMFILFFSSSMTYQEQNVQPLLEKLLSGEPLRGLLEGIRFSYAGSEVSIQASGYTGFIEFFIRKAAHFVSYFLLGLFWFLGIKNRVQPIWLTVMIALLLTTGYASFDELHQSFNPNRTALMEDVFLDSMGAFTGILISWIFFTKRRKPKSKIKKLKIK